MGQDYREVLDVLKKFPELDVKRTTFADAMKDQAYEQLQGQIASARVPLIRFSSKTLYWTLSGDDFSLEMNDPKAPKIICVGNNPKRQSVYGTTLAMLMSQLFKIKAGDIDKVKVIREMLSFNEIDRSFVNHFIFKLFIFKCLEAFTFLARLFICLFFSGFRLSKLLHVVCNALYVFLCHRTGFLLRYLYVRFYLH